MSAKLIDALKGMRSTFGYVDMEGVMPALIALVQAADEMRTLPTYAPHIMFSERHAAFDAAVAALEAALNGKVKP